jgi:spore maturation protein B
LLGITGYGLIKRVKVYEAFTEGAKEGFNNAVRIIPFLVAMLVAIGIFRASGAMELLSKAVAPVTEFIGMPPEILPMALMRPLSGSGAYGIMNDLMATHGADSLIGRMASVMAGSTDTTFYIIAVYFGSVGIHKIRYSMAAGLLSDLAGILAAVWISNLVFG